MAAKLRDQYGEVNPLFPRPQFKRVKNSSTGYRYIKLEVRVSDGRFFRKYLASLPPAYNGDSPTYIGTYDSLQEAVEAQRQGILDRGTNALYLLAHMELPEPPPC